MDTKKLRQKILDLAIHGKLVPQDPNDEPASVLLERIRKEKEQLIKEGKIKAPKKSKSAGDTSHYPKEGPWELPEGWVWCNLEDLCLFLSRGKSPVYSETSRDYPVFAQKCNLKEGGISLEKALFLEPTTLAKWPLEYRLKTGDVLVNSTGTGTVGRTRLFDEKYLGSYPFVVPDSHVSVVRTFTEISSEYVYLLLSSEYGQRYFADNLAGSTNQKELYIAPIAELQLPLPPVNEQERIARLVFDLEQFIAVLDEQIDLVQSTIESLKTKVLDLAIHGKLVSQDPNEEPAIELLKRINPAFAPSDNLHYDDTPVNGWELVQFKDVFDSIPSKPYQIAISDIKGIGRFPVISQGAKDIDGYSDNIERVFKTSVPVYVFGDHTKVLKYIPHDFIVGADGVKILKPRWDSKYLFYHLIYCVSNLENRGYSRNYQYLSSTVLHIPPLAEQNRIVSVIEMFFKELDSISTITT